MHNTFGFIGIGNMGSALARAAVKCMSPDRVFLANKTPEKARLLAAELNCTVADNAWIAANCGFVFLGVKPQMMAGVLGELAPVLAQRQDRVILVSMAAGLTIETLQQMAGGKYPVIRMMPNTPTAVGQGVIQYCHNDLVGNDVLADWLRDMRYCGLLDSLDEHLIDAASALSGSGPAYLYILMEALADGAVTCGLPRAKAMEYAAMTMVGAGQLYLQTHTHPGALKDAVCSPGGSTICGIRALEDKGFRGAAMDCVIATYQKNKELGK